MPDAPLASLTRARTTLPIWYGRSGVTRIARLVRGPRQWLRQRQDRREERIGSAQVQRARHGVEAELARAGQAAELEQGDVAVRDAGRLGQAALAPAVGVAQGGDAATEAAGIGDGARLSVTKHLCSGYCTPLSSSVTILSTFVPR